MTAYVTDPLKVIQTAGETYVGADAGEDTTYLLTANLIEAGDVITIIDDEGTNTIQLPLGLEIASSIVANDEMVLTLSNGAQINIRGASTFVFDVGGNDVSGEVGIEKEFADFVEQDLGTTVPAEGEAPTTGGEVVISPPNEAPVATDDLLAFSVETSGTVEIDVADLLANDTDADGDTLTITAVDDLNPADGTVTLSEDGLTITFDPTDGYTGPASFSYTVSDGEDEDTAVVTGEVVTDNNAPTAIALDAATVAENDAAAIIGNLTVTDPDVDDTFTFAVSDDRFEVVDSQLKLVADTALDFETAATVDVTVTATDAAGASVDQAFTITVTDVNEAPTAIALDTATVAENAAAAVIGTLSATDPDAGDTVTFSVSDERFEIVDNQLKLVADTSLDFEATPTVDVTVTATDAGGLTVDQVLTVTVTNVNEAPTAVALDTTTVAENAVAAVIGTLSVTDPDAGDTFTFSVSDDRFEIVDSQLKLVADASLDFETTPAVDVTVTATDAAGLTVDQVLTVTVTNVNEAPVAADDADAILVENTGTVTIDVATLLANDTDVDGNTLIITAIDDQGTEDGVATLSEDGLTITFDPNDDYTGAVAFGYTVSDGELEASATVTGEVKAPNNAPTAIALDTDTVAENAVAAVIGTLTVTDPDVGDTFTYTVSDDRFEVVDNQLKLVADTSLDFETAATVDVTVTAADPFSASVEQLFTINVTNINEAPTAMALDADTVAENVEGAVIGALTTTDPDAGDTFTYAVDNADFEVVDGHLKLVDGVSLDFEATPTVDVTVTATDAGDLTFDQAFTLTVTDVNEAPTAIALDNATLYENAAGEVIGTLTTTDPDAGDTFTYAVDNADFEVVDGQLKLADGVSLNFEDTPTVDVTVTATDAGDLTFDQAFTLTVDDVNEPTVAVDDAYADVEIGVATPLDVLINDTDEDGDLPVFDDTVDIVVNGPDGATATAEYDMVNEVINFTADMAGDYTFNYDIADGMGGTDTAAVTVTVAQAGTPINDSDFTDGVYNAQAGAELITVDLADWTSTFTINDFNADEDVLIINSDGEYSSVEEFTAANLAGEAGAWGYDGNGDAHIFNPDFNEIALAGITGNTGSESIGDAVADGWLSFI